MNEQQIREEVRNGTRRDLYEAAWAILDARRAASGGPAVSTAHPDDQDTVKDIVQSLARDRCHAW